ncbi:MAG: hypothetical protein COV46_02530 [Deltaproteobacteria bacterium CG11_big_fil_rev_8_21_14_0_20_49_13]|nr:MAG: hypothetical protein COV46_02530 [Deltaproteobacteria bacterium CG11_big_fil_rev_8_21_14_0_20_49_13]
MVKRIFLLTTAVLLLATPVSNAVAGQLDDFEGSLDQKSETKPQDKKDTKHEESSSTSTSDAATGIFESLAGIFMTSLFDMSQEKDMKGLYKYLKRHDIPALPTFRLDGIYQYLVGNMNSFNGRVEAGYLMFGIDGEYKRFWESAPSDALNMAGFHFLVRALFGEMFQINLALGEKFLWGDKSHKGFDIGFPFYVIFGEHFIWDVRPYIATVGGREVYDVGSGLNFKYKFGGVRAGYRLIGAGGRKLQGPEVGLFVQF